MPETAEYLSYEAAVEDVRAWLVAYANEVWGSIRLGDEDIAALVELMVPKVLAGQAQVANLTAAYMASATGSQVAPIVTQSVAAGAETYLRGVAAEMVYARPVITARTALARGRSIVDAVDTGSRRLQSLVTTDLQMARVRQADVSLRRAGRQFYRRVPRGSHTCALCLIASTMRYRTGKLLPIHPGCDCGIDVIDAGRGRVPLVIDPATLEATHDRVKLFTGMAEEDRGGRTPDYRKLIISHEHGEIGPLLGWKDRKFTAAADIPKTPATGPVARRGVPADAAPDTAPGVTPPPGPPTPPPPAAAAAGDGDRERFNRQAADAADSYLPRSRNFIAAERDAVLQDLESDLRTHPQPERFVRAVNSAMVRLVDDSSLVVRVTHLEQVLDSGRFRTQFETGTSGGVLNRDERAMAEAMWFGEPTADNPPRIYGTLETPEMRDSIAGDAYAPGGDGVAVYLKDGTKSRITVTIGDSLARQEMVFPGDPATGRHIAAVDEFRDVTIDEDDDGNADRMYQALVAYPSRPLNPYIEAQIGGGVLVEDIDRVVFNRPPSPEVQRKLAALGIEWE